MRIVGTRTSVGMWLALSLVLVGGQVEATPTSRAAERSVTADEATPQLARRRARQKTKQKRVKQKPVEAPAAGEQAPSAQEASVDAATRRGPTRVEFDERLLQGQTNKANAIYLFQRRESALRSLVKKREHFHEEIDEALE